MTLGLVAVPDKLEDSVGAGFDKAKSLPRQFYFLGLLDPAPKRIATQTTITAMAESQYERSPILPFRADHPV
jgi:hypothetical protein